MKLQDLVAFLKIPTMACTWSYLSFSFLTAVPTAELEPITESYVQADEVRQQANAICLSFYLCGRCTHFVCSGHPELALLVVWRLSLR